MMPATRSDFALKTVAVVAQSVVWRARCSIGDGMDKEQFPLQVKGFRFDAYYQRGSVDLENSRWTKDNNGPHHLVVCACGKGVYASDLDDAVHKLQQSYAVEPDGTHSHDERLTFPCNIIEAVQDGSEPWIMGRLTVPELLKDVANTTERPVRTPPSAPKKPSS